MRRRISRRSFIATLALGSAGCTGYAGCVEPGWLDVGRHEVPTNAPGPPVKLLHLSDPIAVTAMYILGALMHFPAHRWITYGAQDQPIRPQGLRYGVMLVCNFLIMQTIVGLASRVSISPYIAVMVSMGCTMIFNFLVMTHVVFAKRRWL